MKSENHYHERDLTPGVVYSLVGKGFSEGENIARFAGSIEGSLFFIREFEGTGLVTLVCPLSKVIITGEEPMKNEIVKLLGLIKPDQKAQMTVNLGEYWETTTITTLDPRYEILDKSLWGAN